MSPRSPEAAAVGLGARDRDVDRYLDYLAVERRLSPHTLKAYRRDLDALSDWRTGAGIETWAALDSHSARRWLASRHARTDSPRSVARTLSAARSFFRFLLRERQVGANPFTGLRPPKSARTLPDPLSVEQAARLVEAPRDAELGARDRAILELFYSSGLRLAELATLDIADVDLDQAMVRVTGKGRRTRVVPVGRHALSALRLWLTERRGILPGDAEAALFISRQGGRLGVRAIQKRIARAAELSGIGRPVHPHLLRHSFASHMLESSHDLRAVQELLGHADIATTQIYTHLDFQHLARVYDQAHPRARRGRRRDEE